MTPVSNVMGKGMPQLRWMTLDPIVRAIHCITYISIIIVQHPLLSWIDYNPPGTGGGSLFYEIYTGV